MKKTAIILSLLLAVIAGAVFAGCGNSSTPPPQIALMYMVGLGSNSVVGQKILATGQIAPLPVFSFPTNPRPVALALHPNLNFIYVANLTQNTVSGYNLDHATGVLTPVGTAIPPSNVGVSPVGVGVSSNGQFLFVLNQGSATISVFSIDQTRGLLTEISGSPFPTLANPQFLSVSPTAGLLYVANGTLSNISAFNIGATGALSAVAGSPFSVGAGANVQGMAIDPKGLFLFATDSANNKVAAFSIAASGALAPVAGSPFAAGTAPVSVTVDPSGQFVFAANSGSDDVSAYTALAGVLKPVTGSPYTTRATTATTAAQPVFVTVDVTNNYVYVANLQAKTVAAFLLNGTDGTLTAVNNSPFGQGVAPLWILTTK
jgi:6-phosphogluconolactonase (cycloisomerase 2 family)